MLWMASRASASCRRQIRVELMLEPFSSASLGPTSNGSFMERPLSLRMTSHNYMKEREKDVKVQGRI